ncbi:hypothetical protein VIMS_04279 [Mycobacterium marinum]|nr:hypothetical protein VIMS_04279 [Mycobacterium marinum]
MIFFWLADLWFVRAAGRMSAEDGERLINGYYAAMVAAMAWMFAVMNGRLPGLARRRTDPVPRTGQRTHLESLHQVCTAAGTALMFAALL